MSDNELNELWGRLSEINMRLFDIEEFLERLHFERWQPDNDDDEKFVAIKDKFRELVKDNPTALFDDLLQMMMEEPDDDPTK